MTLTTAREWIRDSARNAGSTAMYSEARVDRALLTIGNRFCRETKCLRTLSTATIVAATAAVDISAITGFTPERLMGAYVVGVPSALSMTDWATLWALQVCQGRSGNPEKIAFESTTVLNLYPTPTEAGTLKLRWWQGFTSFTPGTVTPGSVTLNLPDDYLAEILPYGPTSVLQHNEPEMKYAGPTWQKYLEVEARYRAMGAGNLAGHTAARSMDV